MIPAILLKTDCLLASETAILIKIKARTYIMKYKRGIVAIKNINPKVVTSQNINASTYKLPKNITMFFEKPFIASL